jgi:hypothetical protein
MAMLVIGVAGIVAVPTVLRQIRHRYDQRITSSCANHAIELKFLVLQFVEQEDRFPLESDARSAFAKMSPKDYWPANWLSSFGSSCPESYLRDKSIGYVFVADGLTTKEVIGQQALVFFCPADSHQRSEQHCHAVIGDGELLCVTSNIEMVELLRREIGRAEEGAFPYSSNAVSKMQRELEVRENYARRRDPKSLP